MRSQRSTFSPPACRRIRHYVTAEGRRGASGRSSVPVGMSRDPLRVSLRVVSIVSTSRDRVGRSGCRRRGTDRLEGRASAGVASAKKGAANRPDAKASERTTSTSMGMAAQGRGAPASRPRHASCRTSSRYSRALIRSVFTTHSGEGVEPISSARPRATSAEARNARMSPRPAVTPRGHHESRACEIEQPAP